MRGFGQTLTPIGRYRDPRESFARQLMYSGTDTRPIQHWIQGLSRMAQALLGVKLQQKLDRDMQGRVDAKAKAIRDLYTEKVVDIPETTTPDMTGILSPEEKVVRTTDPYQKIDGDINLMGENFTLADRENKSPFTPLVPLDRRNPNALNAPHQITERLIGKGGLGETQFGSESTIDYQPDMSLRMQMPEPEPQIDRNRTLDLTQQWPGTVDPEQSHQELGKYGKALLAMNESQYGGVDPSLLLQGMIRQDDRAYQEELLKKKHQMDIALKGAPPGFNPASIKPNVIEEPVAGGLTQRYLLDPTTKQKTAIGAPYDKNLKSPEAQQQAIDRTKAGQETWKTVPNPRGPGPIQVSSFGQTKAAAPVSLNEAEKKIDQEFGKFYSDYYIEGRMSDVYKGLESMEGIAKRLDAIAKGESEENLTGPYLGLEPDVMKAFTHPESLAVQEDVANIIQRDLRPMLGAQFTEQEGRDLIKRAYNPSLPEAENAKRIRRLVTSMTFAAEQKAKAAKYYEQHGTLKGFKGTANFTKQDYYDAIDGKDSKAMPPKGRKRRASDAPKKPDSVSKADWDNMTPEDRELFR